MREWESAEALEASRAEVRSLQVRSLSYCPAALMTESLESTLDDSSCS